MTLKIKGIGIDCVEIKRFKRFIGNPKHPFLKKVFFATELAYCFSYKNSAEHLAGLFAAKEAVSKTLGVYSFPFAEIEIKHTKNGAPVAYRNSKKLPVKISITHTNSIACSVAVN